MAPKKKEEEPPPVEEPVEPEIPEGVVKKCLKHAGQIYYGDCIYGPYGQLIRQGYGRQVNTAQTVTGESVTLGVYEGYWDGDTMTGGGVYRWSDGSCYEGSFSNGQMHGYGKFTWPEGSVYDGTWQFNEMRGQGRFDSGFDGDFSQGHFHRNCFRQYDGRWFDVYRVREQLRAAKLKIQSTLDPRTVPVMQCPADHQAIMGKCHEALLRNLVPFVFADATAGGSPLPFLEDGDRGLNAKTTLHVSYAAQSKRRQHDYQQLFTNAIQEALLSYRPFALVFGDTDGNPQAGSEGDAVPATWKLSEFFNRHSFPPELFDLKLFHGRGRAHSFLPRDKLDTLLPTMPAHPDAQVLDAEQEAVEEPTGDPPADGTTETPAKPPQMTPPTAYLLRFLLVSLRQLEGGLSPQEIRERVVRRYVEHVPLHRAAIIVIGRE
jgi:hypothetical protein